MNTINPLLGKLTGPLRTPADVADLLERHIGDGTDELRCREALAALQRIRKDHPSYYLRVALRALDGNGTPCELVRAVVTTIRKWRHFSGA